MDFSQQLNACVTQANDALRRFIAPLPFQNTPLVEAMAYGALLGGKRLRPFLVYATGQMFGVSLTALDAPAAAVECIHAYSLMHDDLPAMDDDDLRRGQPTCHIKFGEASAILAGDALQTLAFSILSDAPMPDVSDRDRLAMISELATASGVAGMCGGQALDLDAEGKQVGLEMLERIHRHKTGALIRAAVRLGALSAGEQGRQALPLLDKYAESIGLAFQVQDDILDVVGDTATLGKRQGADQQLGKSTYPALLGLEQARTKASDLIAEARQSLAQLAALSLDTTALEALANYIILRDK
ncbi:MULTISPECIES: (2E,6E)-farnesyl diphosphate synthase [Enterobacteriaceae]|uniref:(2E,6E)-farnesyl diphosphate synthase n=1 Tax=Kluyvera genomosp. 2 TaxID=2774054 RepID=A0A2T2Y0E4_9ENTR|nr:MULTISPECIES: (2E,6E)-farnesyl diphosphate synthase [Enterobacteriaceae]HAT3919216.1 (2E,6E)-farnesyl diphosphate synthase [Kluyvera ascorbata]PSR45986.1 (2E,6E)-farnesyl diphosphate synthase [Kluyvera genomosp. 2]BBQ85044.1 (2E,6E)-farnesyl diphosphate synthase [Klebsiella sp. WP3-W18-ESBL-02]BBR22096.1 (2E,6E)-farnesyl diphosphate synthase [Klebsiella sp. WP3-S18-ESBL-05]BBR57745.1 (2E,6E)-farnesyl diphosphate synthase [Klebsiella sp. WP4-W18-ESBL-05]